MTRDFTYIDDIIESLIRVIKKVPESNRNFNYILQNQIQVGHPTESLILATRNQHL